MINDPRIDKLGRTSILTDTQFRLAFAPADPEAPVIAITVPIRAAALAAMQSRLKLGRVHLQVKEAFGAERHIELSGPELFMLHSLADRLISEMPTAKTLVEQDDDEEDFGRSDMGFGDDEG